MAMICPFILILLSITHFSMSYDANFRKIPSLTRRRLKAIKGGDLDGWTPPNPESYVFTPPEVDIDQDTYQSLSTEHPNIMSTLRLPKLS